MKRFRMISLPFVPLLASSIVLAQTGDWQAVRSLQPGTKISVRSRHPFRSRCTFDHATDKQLVCERILRGSSRAMIPSYAVYERDSIREVRLEHSEAANVATGVVIGGGIGAATGANAGNDSLTRGGAALLLGTDGAIVGGFFARDFPVIHGKVVYRR